MSDAARRTLLGKSARRAWLSPQFAGSGWTAPGIPHRRGRSEVGHGFLLVPQILSRTGHSR